MYSKYLILSLAAQHSEVSAWKQSPPFDFTKMMEGVDPKTWHSHPRVEATNPNCKLNVDALKKGPVNIPEIVYNGS